MKLQILGYAFAASFVVAVNPSQALGNDIVFTGSGTGTSGSAISATATFEFVTHDFGSGAANAVLVTLANTADSTTLRGNLITGLFFSLSGNVGNLPSTSAGFDGMAAIVTTASGTVHNKDVAPAVNNTLTDGGYQLSNGPFGTANSGASYSAFKYAIATVGMGLSGFNGNAVNNDDYGIFAAGSNVSSPGFANALPLIDSSVQFWVLRPGGWTSLSQLGPSVRISYGSQPDNFVTATETDTDDPPGAAPEPSSMALLGTGIAFGSVAWRRRRGMTLPQPAL